MELNQTEDIKNLSSSDIQEIMRLANIIYFKNKAYENSYWAGIKTAKNPMDMWVYQEIIHNLQVDLVIETGTYFGGSALYFAHIFDIIGAGKVVSVDLQIPKDLPQHPRIEYIEGSSVDRSVLKQIESIHKAASSTMVILDSDHRKNHKLMELSLYSKFVSPNSYMIAEDSCFDFYPAWPEFGEGPAHAVKEFMENNANFTIDRNMEKHLITFSPKAFLKKTN